MAETINVKIYDSLRENLHLNENEAKNFAKDLNTMFDQEDYVTKKDLQLLKEELKNEMIKTAFWSGIIQIATLLACITGILSFMLSHYKL